MLLAQFVFAANPSFQQMTNYVLPFTPTATTWANYQTLQWTPRLPLTLTNSTLVLSNDAFYHATIYKRINGTNYAFLGSRNNNAGPGFTTNVASLIRVNMDNPNQVDFASVTNDNYYRLSSVTSVGEKLYFVTAIAGTATNSVLELDPYNLNIRHLGYLPSPFNNGLASIASDNTNLCIIAGGALGIAGIFTTNLSLVLTNKLSVNQFTTTNGSSPHSIFYDGAGLYYFSCYLNTNFQTIGVMSPTNLVPTYYSYRTNAYDISLLTDDSCDAGDYAYYGGETFMAGLPNCVMARFNKITKSFDYIGTGIVSCSSYGNWFYGGSIWSAWAGTNSYLTRFDPATRRVDVFNSPVQYPNEIVYDGTKFLVTSWNDYPARIASFLPESLTLSWSVISRFDGTIATMITNGVAYPYGAVTTNYQVSIPLVGTNTLCFTNGALMNVTRP